MYQQPPFVSLIKKMMDLVVLRLTSMVSLLSFLGITLMYSRLKRLF